MRPIDADALYQTEKLLGTNIVRQDKVASELLAQVLYDIRHFPLLNSPNEPLSWAELTKMYGEPVYIVVMGVWGVWEYWAIVKYAYNGGVYLAAVNGIDDYGSESLYGKTWLAYRRPPERQEEGGDRR